MRPDLGAEGHEFLFDCADKNHNQKIDILDWLNVSCVKIGRLVVCLIEFAGLFVSWLVRCLVGLV